MLETEQPVSVKTPYVTSTSGTPWLRQRVQKISFSHQPHPLVGQQTTVLWLYEMTQKTL